MLYTFHTKALKAERTQNNIPSIPNHTGIQHNNQRTFNAPMLEGALVVYAHVLNFPRYLG